MLSQHIIDEVLMEIQDQNIDSGEYFNHLSDTYPAIFYYLFDSDQEVLLEEEQDYLLFLSMVILKSLAKALGSLKEIDLESIHMVEEDNWETWNSSNGNFHEKLDLFFEHTPEEDLLAFVEDALSEGDSDFLTQTGRTVIWVKLKSLIDALT